MGKGKNRNYRNCRTQEHSKLANLGDCGVEKMLTVRFYLARAIIDFIRNGKTAQKIQTGFFFVFSSLIFFLVETNKT